MYTKVLHARKNLANEDTTDSVQQPTILEYSLITKNQDVRCQEETPSQYGICVSMMVGEATREESMIRDLSVNKKRVEDLLALLTRNSVTPVSVDEVVTDCFYI